MAPRPGARRVPALATESTKRLLPVRIVMAVVVAAAAAGCSGAGNSGVGLSMVGLSDVVPVPAQVSVDSKTGYTLTAADAIHAGPGAEAPAALLAGVLRPATGFYLPVDSSTGQGTGISLQLDTATDRLIGDQGYRLIVGRGVRIRANTPAGLFNGVETLRQLFGPEIDSDTAQPGPWKIQGGSITDHPRFPYRSALLDVARRFRPKADVERYIDDIARYKINFLQLHLTDDQGWRIRIDKWPNLTDIGARSQVGGGPGGYYSQADYASIVAYAAAHGITVVPVIDGPGHTNAALNSYPELTCDGKPTPPRTDTQIGYSSLCVGKELTYTFLDDVFAEVAALTPGPYLNIGGDEAQSTTPADYRTYMSRVLPSIAAKYGKTVIGAHEITQTGDLPRSAILEYWGTVGGPNKSAIEAAATRSTIAAAHNGNKIVLIPPERTYLDMKYNPRTKRGQDWAGFVDVDASYNWDPGNYLHGVNENSILGIGALLWTETIPSLHDAEYMTFPRLPAIAELGWSPISTHNWTSFSRRLAEQAAFWTNAGIAYYHSPKITWPNR